MELNTAVHRQPIAIPPIHALLKASADSLRLQILKVLYKSSFAVLELSQILEMKQSGMSHHLKILSQAGLLTTRREANVIFYQRALTPWTTALSPLQQAIIDAVDGSFLAPEIEQRIEAVYNARSKHSGQLFSENNQAFREQHEQISPYNFYGTQTGQLLDQRSRADCNSVLEIGSGEGYFLAELSSRFERVYALDCCSAMLDRSKEFCAQLGLNNIAFIEGNTSHPELRTLQPGCIILNMVLHHIPAPERLFEDLVKILSPGGQLFITDLCDHNHRSAKEACGDIWLGFEPELISNWAKAAGFIDGESLYLSQRNGFKVQSREFIKE